LNDIAVVDERRPLGLECLAVDQRPVGAVQVDDEDAIRFQPHLGMQARDPLLVGVMTVQINVRDHGLPLDRASNGVVVAAEEG
jgi:hypothetical protein